MQTRCLHKPAYFLWKLSSFFYIASALYGISWKLQKSMEILFFVRMIYKLDPVNTLCLVTIHLDLLLPIAHTNPNPSGITELCSRVPIRSCSCACRAFFVTKKAVSSTSPFHPYLIKRRHIFCGAFPQVTLASH